MSKCISGQGEYSDHVGGDEEFVCGRCYVVDEEAMRAEIERLRAGRPSATDNARAEALAKERYPLREETNYHAGLYRGFLEGWAAARAETTTEWAASRAVPSDQRKALLRYAQGLIDGMAQRPEVVASDAAHAIRKLLGEPTVERLAGEHTCPAVPSDQGSGYCPDPLCEHDDCQPPSDYTATTEDAEAVVVAEFDNAPDEGWDSLTFAQYIVKALAGAGLLATARTRPTEGTRWYVPAYRTPEPNSRVHRLGSPTVLREYAEREVEAYRAQEADDPEGNPDVIFLATRLEYPWTEVDR